MNLTRRYLERRPKELIINSIETSYDPFSMSVRIQFKLDNKVGYAIQLSDLERLDDSIHLNHIVHMLSDRLQSEFYKHTGERTYVNPEAIYKRLLMSLVDSVPRNILLSRARENAANRVISDMQQQIERNIFGSINQYLTQSNDSQYAQAATTTDLFRRRRL